MKMEGPKIIWKEEIWLKLCLEMNPKGLATILVDKIGLNLLYQQANFNI
jgi:hypothetical protein